MDVHSNQVRKNELKSKNINIINSSVNVKSSPNMLFEKVRSNITDLEG